MSLQAAAGRFLPYIIKGYYRRTVPYRRRAFLVPNIPSVPVKPVFAHRVSQKMRRVPQEAFLSTARIFRTPGGPLRYRMPTPPP